MQNKKRRSKRTHKTKIRNVKSIMFENMHLVYSEKHDRFVCYMIVYINNIKLSIIGDLDPDMYTQGIKIKTPNGIQTYNTNCNELFISRKDAPNIYSSIIGFINDTGDKLDSNEYDKYSHGSLDLIKEDFLVSDKNIDKFIQRLSYYD